MKAFKIKIFADGANLDSMRQNRYLSYISGYTTNPSLARKAGVENYFEFAKALVEEFPDKSISLEVINDEGSVMEREAKKLSSLGKNVMVKIPIISSNGINSVKSIERLSSQGVNLNITAMFTKEQAYDVIKVLNPDTKNYLSVFAGRIADTGVDPVPIVKAYKEICGIKSNTFVLWASCREVLNIIQAESIGCDIITVTDDILSKLNLLGKDLEQYSLETAKMFARDARASNFYIDVD